MADNPRQLILWTIAMAALAVAVLWAAYLVRGVLLLIYVCGLLAIGFSPLVRLLERQKLFPIGTRRYPRWLAILLIYMIIIGTIAAIAVAIVPPLVAQAQALWTALPGMIDRAQGYLIAKGLLDHRITLREAFQGAPQGGVAVDTVVAAISGVVGGVIGLFTMLILTFYLLIEAEPLFNGFLRLFPRSRRGQISAVCRQITIKVSAWLMGQLVLAGVIGLTAGFGLWLMGVPYYFVLALIAAIGELIPVVGPVLSAIPAVAVALTISPGRALSVLVYFIVQQQFENHVLVPKVMSRQVGISAVTVIVALLIGGSLLGIVGAILAVPTTAILQVLFQELVASDDAAGADV